MKTKIRLTLIINFFVTSIFAQINWVGYTPGETFPGDGLTQTYTIAFNSQNDFYVYGYNQIMGENEIWKHTQNNWQILASALGFYPMAVDKNDLLWVTDDNNYLNYFDTVSQNLIPIASGSFFYDKSPPSLFTVDKFNTKWIACSQTFGPGQYSWCICTYDGNSFTAFDTSITGIIYEPPAACPYPNADAMVAANNSLKIFVTGSFNGIVMYDGITWTKIDSTNSNFKGSTFIRDIKIDVYDNLWISAKDFALGKNCLVKFDGIQFYYYYSPLNFPYFGLITTDLTGNIWIDVPDSGLIKFDGVNWNLFDDSQNDGFIYPDGGYLASDNNGIIYNCSNGGVGLPLLLFNENGFQTIDGNVFKDVNANGVHDVSENGIPHEMVRSSEGMCALSDSAGDYHLYFTDSTNTITVTHNLIKYRYHSTIPTSYSINPLSQNTTGKDFGVAEVTNVNDLQIYSNMFPTRPGFVSYGSISYYNIGTTTLSDTITIQLDGRYTFLNSQPSPTIINGNKLQWLFNNLAPLQSSGISLHLRVDSTAVIGDTLFSLATIGPVISDTVPSDNMNFIYKVVHGSYDPNEKEVEPKGTGPNGNIPNGQTLNYTIHFQNTGTDTAFTVTVKDTLSSNLDINTFQFTGSSHPCIYEITGAGNMKFTFYNILLTDTFTNEPMSHGYISYKIKAIDNLPLGTQIKNTAFIYFDFNAPIVTNTTLNTIANTTGIPFIKNDYSANVFPNPLQDVATLEINGMNLSSKLTVKLYDAMGREMNVAVSKMDNNRFAIHRNDLTSGLYFYKVSDRNVLISSGKITVQ